MFNLRVDGGFVDRTLPSDDDRSTTIILHSVTRPGCLPTTIRRSPCPEMQPKGRSSLRFTR